MSSLIENINTSYIEAQNSLRSSKEPLVISVYVESEDDISHWNSVLSKTIRTNQKIKFDINLPTRNGYEKGKYNVLNIFKNSIGKHLILCLDSDYDYLLPDRNEDSVLINTSDYIFHTYTYSIENLYSHGNGLNNFCIQCVKSTSLPINLDEIMLKYSRIIYELFCWNVFLYSRNMEEYFTISDFTEAVKILINSDINNDFKSSFDCLEERIYNKLEELNVKFSSILNQKDEFKVHLNNKGVNPDNCYLYVHGHSILENVVLMFLKPIIKRCRGEKLRTIYSAPISETQKENEKNHYLKIASKEDDLIREIYSHFDFLECEEFLKTKNDLQRYAVQYLN